MISLLILVGCGDMRPASPSMSREESPSEQDAWGGASADAPAPSGAVSEPSLAAASPRMMTLGYLEKTKEKANDEAEGGEGKGGKDEGPAAPTRAWFPESFLWVPMVETDASGVATVPLRVPDTLTTWRLLALAQTRAGAQAGTTHTFLSTLPAYIDVGTPSFLYAGDAAQVPIQLVNQEEHAIREVLTVEVTGGSGGGGGSVEVGPGSTREESVRVVAGAPGSLLLRAGFGEVDTVEKTVPVRPVGRPIEQARGGTLGGPRTFGLSATPDGRFGSLDLTVFPGGLGVIRQELDAAALRDGTVADAAYTWALVGMAAPMVGSSGVEAEALRALSIRAYQRLTRATRNPTPSVAADALAGLRGAPADGLAGRLATRLATTVREAQQPDGLWGLSGGQTLDQVLVQTARCAWALGPEEKAGRLRATGAFERYRERLANPYVIAWALAAGVVEKGSEEAARAKLVEALRVAPDGSRTLRVSARRPDGSSATEAEATALAILAVTDGALRSDLASGLLGLYRPSSGFGDGVSNLLAVRALAEVFSGEIPKSVAIRLEIDGAVVATGTLDPSQPYQPVRLRAAGLSGVTEHEVRVVSEPAVPGLAFTLVAQDWVPWVASAPAGLELRVGRPMTQVLGEPGSLHVEVAGPADLPVDIEIGLPAGTDADRPALTALAQSGRIAGFAAEDGRITLRGVRLAGGAWQADLRVTPTLAGALLSGASRVWPSGDEVQAFVVPPEVWRIGGG